MKLIFRLWIIILIGAYLAACNARTLTRTSQITPLTQPTVQTQSPEINSSGQIELTDPPENPPSENNKDQFSWAPVNEDQFVDELNITHLEMIAEEIQSLITEIQEKERADPDYVLQGKWNEDFRSSQQYHEVLDLGLEAVKPAYYIIYKSPKSGLYEYIIASAIDEITGYDYSVTEDYGWSNSKQFLEMYNDKVKQTLNSFSIILDNSTLNEAAKAEQIRALGIFAVAPLLNEIDSNSNNLSSYSLESCLWNIVDDYYGKSINHDLDNWRNEHEETCRDIIEILE